MKLEKMGGMALLALTLLCGGVACAKTAKAVPEQSAVAQESAKLTVEPTPKWVEPVSAEGASSDNTAPMSFALVDKQVKVGPEGVSRYEHVVKEMRQVSAVETGSQIQIEFDPSYQTLVMHQMAVWRNGKRIDKLHVQAFKILQRETQLERLIYDGRATASLVLDDVRVGDRIEFAYTLKGQNPVFGGKFVEMDWGMSPQAPISRYRFRLLHPADRHIYRRLREDIFKLSERAVDGQHEFLVERRQVPVWVFDRSAPLASYLDEALQWSEFADWAEVAHWAQGLFARSIESNGPVKDEVLQLTAQSTTDDDRVRRTLDFVQSQVRYFGTEIGANSHLPAQAQTVLKQRYGDCKDKAALLVSMLRAIGIQAEPVLVSMAYQEGVSDVLPSPLAFDHAIAQARIGDQVYWLDGTRSYQAGALPYRNAVGLGKVLPAVAGQANLVDTPDPTQVVRVESRDVFHFTSLADEPTLSSTLTYRGELAEVWRQVLGSQSGTEFQKVALSHYMRVYPGLVVFEPLKMVDDAEHNAVTLTISYKLNDYLRFPQQRALVGDYALMSLVEALQLPSQAPRTKPLRVNFPGIYRHTVDYEFEQDIFDVPTSSHIDDQNDFFSLHLDFEGSARHYSISGELQRLTHVVEVKDWDKYKEALSKTWPKVGNVMILPPMSAAQAEQLKREMQAFSDDVKRGRAEAKSAVQVQAALKAMALKAVLDANRLQPKLRLDVLIDLGESQDLLGRFDQAEQSFKDALSIDRKSRQAHAGLAVNAVMRGRYAAGESEAATALSFEPNQHPTRLVRAQALFYLRRYAEAKAELQTLLKHRSEMEGSYAALWMYLTASRLGEDPMAAIKPYLPSGSRPAWPYPVLQMFMGVQDVRKAEALAKDGDKVDQGKLCELFYFRGMQDLLAGDASSARSNFRKSMDTGIVEFMEYGFAKRELELMD